ncbi:MAG: molybdenum cofactor biosynthesis protein MoaE [Bacteroidetes bacterium]|nr:molybdenum cofactor biosynthesis protein MoaE [Bacteroidota bacterium]
MKSIFIKGPITAAFIANSISKHQVKHNIGAHNIFLGQVRADEIDAKTVSSINFTAYEDMANKAAHDIRENAFEKFDLSCLHIYHSLGDVKVGEVCLFVFVSAPHSPEVYAATEYLVKSVKKEVPIFGKEIFEDSSYQWKVNK